MNKYQTKAIIVRRVNYGEADRIITFMTENHGMVGALAKGVRKISSKLAGGLELFSVSDVTFLKGRGELERVVSTRLEKHFGGIVKDYNRTKFAYDILKKTARRFEHDKTDEGYKLLYFSFHQLDDHNVDLHVIELWFYLSTLKIYGHQPNLKQDTQGNALNENSQYSFDIEHGTFIPNKSGHYDSGHIKTLRLLLDKTPVEIAKINGINNKVIDVLPVMKKFSEYWLY